jgi:hypothetical protein
MHKIILMVAAACCAGGALAQSASATSAYGTSSTSRPSAASTPGTLPSQPSQPLGSSTAVPGSAGDMSGDANTISGSTRSRMGASSGGVADSRHFGLGAAGGTFIGGAGPESLLGGSGTSTANTPSVLTQPSTGNVDCPPFLVKTPRGCREPGRAL